jgi:hypothetical protein
MKVKYENRSQVLFGVWAGLQKRSIEEFLIAGGIDKKIRVDYIFLAYQERRRGFWPDDAPGNLVIAAKVPTPAR